MARPARIEFPGAFYHVTSRGNDKKNIFSSNLDRARFLDFLQIGHDRYGAIIHVYCLMGNHFHLLLETPQGNLSKIMHFINCSYSMYFNATHERYGHFLQGRYKAILIEAESYIQSLSRYVHLNPVRAGLVSLPESYPWSSYREYLGLRKAPDWLRIEFLLSSFGEMPEQARSRYAEFVGTSTLQTVDDPFINMRCSFILGSDNFVERYKKLSEGLSEGSGLDLTPSFPNFNRRGEQA